jgi:cell division septum initiation protein DivIVA
MTDTTPQFRTTMRGYDPAAVDHRIAELTAALGAANQHSAELSEKVEQLTSFVNESRRQADREPAAATFADFGERIGKILTIAEQEAEHIRSTADAEVEQKLAAIESTNSKLRTDAERYAAETRAAAQREAGRIVEEAKRASDQLLDDAERQATARGEEAEAIYEHQRAQAAKAAADFEQTLAARREMAEKVFLERTALAEQQLASAQEHAAQLRAETAQMTDEATRKAARITAESEAAAEQIVAEAATRAERIRAESERELVAATQRRDSINAQLSNVRQMLTTLSGAGPGKNVEDPFGGDDAAEQSANETPAAKNAKDGKDAKDTDGAKASAGRS